MKNSEIINELTRLKKAIEEAKSDKSKIEGRLEELLKSLKEQFGFNSIEEAQEGIEKLQEELTELEKEIQDKFAAIKKEFQW